MHIDICNSKKQGAPGVKFIVNGTLRIDYNHIQFAWTFCPTKIKTVQIVSSFGQKMFDV